MLAKTYADGKGVSYTYYNTGKLKTTTNGRGQTTTYYWDADGSLLKIDYADGNTPDVQYTYDAYNRLITVLDGTGTTTYGYDSASRLKTVDGPWENDTMTYGYDNVGSLASVEVENGQTRTYSYDSLGRLASISVDGREYAYDYQSSASPLVAKLTRPTNITTHYSYDGLNRLLGIDNRNSAGESINSSVYTYNENDLRDGETITGGLSLPTLAEVRVDTDFNEVNQLLSSNNPAQSFTYDDDGNMLTGYTIDGFAFTATYDEASRLTTLSY